MVTSPTLDFRGDLVVAVIAFFQGCSRACERTLAPLGQPGD
jgi:pyruvate-formate lyase-activating enzyme